MSERQHLQPGPSTVTQVEEGTVEQSRSPAVKLKLKKPKNDKKVKWDEGTVDNEFMDKKKSKCCCIYEKPRLFGESSDESDDDDSCSKNCRGHKKNCFKSPPGNGGEGSPDGEGAVGGSA